MPGLSTPYSASWKVKAAPSLEMGGWGRWGLGQEEASHIAATYTLHLPGPSHLLCVSMMLMVAHDSDLPTGPEGMEMRHCREEGRTSAVRGLEEGDWPFLFFVCPCGLSNLYKIVHICSWKTPNLSLPPPPLSSLIIISLFLS